MVAKRRLFAPIGPGLKQIREGSDGKIYILASPSPGLVVYSPEARRLLTMHEASALPQAALAEARASGDGNGDGAGGNGAAGGPTNRLFFIARINGENAGLFGVIDPAPEPGSLALLSGLAASRRRRSRPR